MELFAAHQSSTTSVGDHPGATCRTERRCVLFGCVEAAAWIVSDAQGGELPACEVDLDVLLNDALSRVPPDSRVRAWRCGVPEDHLTTVSSLGRHTDTGCGHGRVAAMRTSSPLPHAQLREPREGAVIATVMQAYKFALDPTPRQRRALASHCGAARVAYNWGLELVKSRLDQRRGGDNVEVPWTLPELRREWNRAKQHVAPWWAENSKEAYSSGLDGLARALKNWADSRSDQRKGRPMRFPRRKRKRRTRDTCRFTTGAIHVLSDRKHVQLPRLGILKTHESTRKLARRIEKDTARLLAATISRTADRWYVSFTVEVERCIPASNCKPTVVGVDVGVNHLAVLSTGERVPNPRALESVQHSRRRLQRRWTRRERRRKAESLGRPSRRQLRTHRQLARLEARAANIRRNELHQLTKRLVSNHGAIVVEQLNVMGMLSNRRLARVVADAGFGEIRRLLRYKAVWYGATLVVADLFYPSTKTCSGCGAAKGKLPLAQRIFRCEGCGAVIDRDLNAARNLAKLVIDVAGSGPEIGNARRVDISPGLAGLTAMKREAGTGRGPGETGTVSA